MGRGRVQAAFIKREKIPWLSSEMGTQGNECCGLVFNIAVVKKDKVKNGSWAAGLLGCQVFMGNSVLVGLQCSRL